MRIEILIWQFLALYLEITNTTIQRFDRTFSGPYQVYQDEILVTAAYCLLFICVKYHVLSRQSSTDNDGYLPI